MPDFHDLTGERFGELLVLRPLRSRRTGNVVWLCRCFGCGADIARDARRLERNRGFVQTCRECARERTRGAGIERRQAIMEHLVDVYKDTGSLYSAWATHHMMEEIMTELVTEHGPILEEALPDQTTGYEEKPKRERPYTQRAAFLLPIGAADAQWSCVTCGGAFSWGLFCGSCRFPVCRDCVGAECHRCARSWECVQDEALTNAMLEEALAFATEAGQHTPQTLLPLVPREQQRGRAREHWQTRSALTESQVIELARAQSEKERHNLERRIRRSNAKRSRQAEREMRKRLRRMPASVRRILFGVAEDAETKWATMG